jgi:hypothetical protein
MIFDVLNLLAEEFSLCFSSLACQSLLPPPVATRVMKQRKSGKVRGERRKGKNFSCDLGKSEKQKQERQTADKNFSCHFHHNFIADNYDDGF